MRYFLLLLFSFCGSSLCLSQHLRYPSQPARLYAHLCEINAYWQSMTTPVGLLDTFQFTSDQERIQTHLLLVTQKLKERSISSLHPQQQQRRLALLDSLHQYASNGRFPRNTRHQKRTPYFVDDQGTACAVGYLMLVDGQAEIVAQIREENNYATIEELLVYPDLQQWADQNGFTTDELAWIQPGYAVVYFEPTAIGSGAGISEGEVNDIVAFEDLVYFGGQFSALDGQPAANFAAWDGTDFLTVPGITGSIHRLAVDELSGDLYAIGQLTDTIGLPVQVARYRDGEWTHLLGSNELDTATVLTDLICHQGQCYIGGHIPSLLDAPANNLIVFDTQSETWSVFPTDVILNGTIYDMDIKGDSLLVGGDLTITDPSEDTVSTYFGLFSNTTGELIEGYSLDHFGEGAFVEAVSLFSGFSDDRFTLYIRATDTQYFYYGWTTTISSGSAQTFPLRYLQHSNSLYGGFISDYDPDADHFPVFFTVPGKFGADFFRFATANGPITAMIKWNEEFIIAGTFTELDGLPLNSLARATLLVSNTEEQVLRERPIVRSDGQNLHLEQLPSSWKDARLELFDGQGRLVWKTTLSAGETAQWLRPPALPSGTYVYRLVIDQSSSAGQVVLIH